MPWKQGIPLHSWGEGRGKIAGNVELDTGEGDFGSGATVRSRCGDDKSGRRAAPQPAQETLEDGEVANMSAPNKGTERRPDRLRELVDLLARLRRRHTQGLNQSDEGRPQNYFSTL